MRLSWYSPSQATAQALDVEPHQRALHSSVASELADLVAYVVYTDIPTLIHRYKSSAAAGYGAAVRLRRYNKKTGVKLHKAVVSPVKVYDRVRETVRRGGREQQQVVRVRDFKKKIRVNTKPGCKGFQNFVREEKKMGLVVRWTEQTRCTFGPGSLRSYTTEQAVAYQRKSEISPVY
ncbi:hypothetical protein PoB_005600300 [Plakobranchus ocellatus]|uniref:Uncharacterized protein n=1 Tax=Plakobranchus ocellatus TaxID=259542 RepID=A0AAV4CCA9_9GAST|nr:hypothetical protein PoB_005600300 [Plakobranchus ocellatus]